MIEPFWAADTIDREPVLFLRERPGERPTAPLLLAPAEILRVASAAGEATYEPERDYRLRPGTRTLELPPGSRIPFRTAEQMHPPPGAPDSIAPAPGGRATLFFAEGHVFHDLQAVVTYRPAERWAGFVPPGAGGRLPRTLERLRRGGALRIAVLGDSISAGANASKATGAPPHQPAYPELVTEILRRRGGGAVELTNLSVGGKATPWALEQAAAVIDARPDLAILAFGMNDAWALSAEVFGRNMRALRDVIRAGAPDAEFILVAGMLPNPEWGLDLPLFARYRDELARLCGPGTALADLTALWADLLARKRFLDLAGNGVNHPNDFGHRLYAQVLLALLAP